MGLPESYMHELGREYQGVQFPDGRYFGSLMVYHHLHCLKHIYHALYPESYAEARPVVGKEDEFQKHTGKSTKFRSSSRTSVTLTTLQNIALAPSRHTSCVRLM